MPISRVVVFPAVKALFDRELARLQLSDNQFAKRIGKSASTLYNYRNGLRPIPEPLIDTVVQAFYRNDRPRQTALRKEFDDALRSPATGGNLLEDVKAGRHLDVTSIANYLPISGGKGAFFDKFAARFSELVGIPFEPRVTPMRGDTQYSFNSVLLSLFDSPDRMLHLRFFRFPIRMTLGAVTDRLYMNEMNLSSMDIARVLSNPEYKELIKRGVRPIVVKGEVGYINCRKRLKFDNLSEVSELNIANLIEQLNTDLVIARSGGPVPVICADELTAMRAAGELGTRAARVFPLSSRRTARENTASRDLPQYYASIAVRRLDGVKTFYFFLLDAISQFLSTEVETTSVWWADLARDLTNTIAQELSRQDEAYSGHEEEKYPHYWAEAWEWVQYVMHLDKESIASYADTNALPWKPILRRARTIRHHVFAEDDGLLRKQVRRAMALFPEEPACYVRHLVDEFDVPLHETVGSNDGENEIIEKLRTALRSEDVIPLVFA